MICVLDSLYLQIHPDSSLLRWEWRGIMSPLRFQVAFNHLLAYSVRYRVQRWMADTAAMPPVGSSEQAWFSDEWLPQANNQGLALKNFALVLPANLHNQLALESMLADGRRYWSINVQFFSDTTTALDWLTNSSAVLYALEGEWQAAHTIGWQAGSLVA